MAAATSSATRPRRRAAPTTATVAIPVSTILCAPLEAVITTAPDCRTWHPMLAEGWSFTKTVQSWPVSNPRFQSIGYPLHFEPARPDVRRGREALVCALRLSLFVPFRAMPNPWKNSTGARQSTCIAIQQRPTRHLCAPRDTPYGKYIPGNPNIIARNMPERE